MTLTEASAFFKRFFKVGLIGIILLILLWIGLSYGLGYYFKLNPPQESASVRFGKIAKPAFPENSTKNLSFVRDTVDGKLPVFSKVLPVYPFVTPSPNLLDLGRAKEIAANFGFTGEPTKSSGSVYTITEPGNSSQEFRIDIVSKNFNLFTSNLADPLLSTKPPTESTDDLITSTRQLLEGFKLLPEDLKKSSASVAYKKISGNAFVDVSSPSEANVARVDIFRDGVAGYPILGPKKESSLVYLMLAKSDYQKKDKLEVGYTYWSYLIDGSSTYPIITAEVAWAALISGQATLISPATASFSEVRIKEISLGYFQPSDHQPYMEPIVVFDGEASATSGPEIPVRLYLPAIDPSYLN